MTCFFSTNFLGRFFHCVQIYADIFTDWIIHQSAFQQHNTQRSGSKPVWKDISCRIQLQVTRTRTTWATFTISEVHLVSSLWTKRKYSHKGKAAPPVSEQVAQERETLHWVSAFPTWKVFPLIIMSIEWRSREVLPLSPPEPARASISSFGISSLWYHLRIISPCKASGMHSHSQSTIY